MIPLIASEKMKVVECLTAQIRLRVGGKLEAFQRLLKEVALVLPGSAQGVLIERSRRSCSE